MIFFCLLFQTLFGNKNFFIQISWWQPNDHYLNDVNMNNKILFRINKKNYLNDVDKIKLMIDFSSHLLLRLLNAPTVTKIWLRYYLEQLFGEQWRRPSTGSSGRTTRQNSITNTTVRRRSRITTHDRDQGKRFYKGTSFSDKSECACEDI